MFVLNFLDVGGKYKELGMTKLLFKLDAIFAILLDSMNS